jgi:hypothetical protein
MKALVPESTQVCPECGFPQTEIMLMDYLSGTGYVRAVQQFCADPGYRSI